MPPWREPERTLDAMRSRNAALWIIAFVVLALLGGTNLLRDEEGSSDDDGISRASTGVVVRVVDGDTVRVRLGRTTQTVRYIGVDTPETVKPNEPVQCFGPQASAYNKHLVANRRVRLQFGPERHDRYGRLLAYVYVVGEKRSVSAELVARGYGRVIAIAPNTAHVRAYLRLERSARHERLGLWGACPVRDGSF
jgi:micrococcal nuclease